MDLATLQDEHKEWVDRNFPDQIEHHGLLGSIEEGGELALSTLLKLAHIQEAFGRLAHSHLKREQGIRGSVEQHDADIEDAIGDVVIFLASYCNTNDIDLNACVTTAWDQVKGRDWQANKATGTVMNGASS